MKLDNQIIYFKIRLSAKKVAVVPICLKVWGGDRREEEEGEGRGQGGIVVSVSSGGGGRKK